MERLECFVGIDWGSETHQACIIDSEGTILGERAFRHGGAGLAEMADWLVATANAELPAIGVAIEVPHGPVVETLMERGFALHSLNPKQLDRFRDRFSPAGARDDRRDARTLGDALRGDRHAFRHLDPAAPEIVELREWSRIANDLTGERTGERTRLASSSGATTRSSSRSRAISPRSGPVISGPLHRPPTRRGASASRPSPVS